MHNLLISECLDIVKLIKYSTKSTPNGIIMFYASKNIVPGKDIIHSNALADVTRHLIGYVKNLRECIVRYTVGAPISLVASLVIG